MFDLSDFFDFGLEPAQALAGTYNPALVVVSYLIASLGSYAFLQFAEQITGIVDRVLRLGWLAGGALAMGCGIWAMHFVGMLAHILPIPVSYDVVITALSAVPAILAAGVALHVVARPAVSARRLLIGGTLMGAGIGTMHYTGMAAMRLDALVRYDPVLFATSVAVAVVLAIIALQVRFWIGRVRDARPTLLRQAGGALILGFAVTAMHYTAMASTYCFAGGAPRFYSLGLDSKVFATVITLIVALVLLIAIASVLFARRIGTEVAMREQAMDSERRTSEQLVQAQKMEAVGQLTGGVAHDFNNILMLMMAHVDALRDDDGVAISVHPRLDKMGEAVQRATDLIRQLLAFSRKQMLKPQQTVLNDLVSTTGRLLRRTLGEHIEIQAVIDPNLWSTNVDRAQVEAALVNLCVNARDRRGRAAVARNARRVHVRLRRERPAARRPAGRRRAPAVQTVPQDRAGADRPRSPCGAKRADESRLISVVSPCRSRLTPRICCRSTPPTAPAGRPWHRRRRSSRPRRSRCRSRAATPRAFACSDAARARG